MKRSLTLLFLLPLSLWAAFALPEVLSKSPADLWAWRGPLIFLSGLLALWWMSAGIVLASRPRWLEQGLNGLDKLYQLHRNIGIGAGLLVLLHWQLEWLPKTLVKAGLIAGSGRPRRPRGDPQVWIEAAKVIGEWAGYLLLALVVIALIRRIPYHWFRQLHKAFGVIFLAGVFHGLLLMPASYWQSPLAWLSVAVAAAGVLPALLSLSGRIGRQRQTSASIQSIHQPAHGLLEIVCRPQVWPGHRSGQFVLADFGKAREGQHPFTIASAWDPRQGTLTLCIKALGDFTRELPHHLQIGQSIRLEGPYGQFDFAASQAVDRNPQIWIAGGIGITPFLARIDEIRHAPHPQRGRIDLYYCTRDVLSYPVHLEAHCEAAGIHLHRRVSSREGPLPASAIIDSLKAPATVWFCGPAAWGNALEKSVLASGLPQSTFRREHFEFR